MRGLAGMLLILWCSAGCGYFASGTWDDDPANWTRAFQSVKPPGVVVVHSRYSRFAHWTFEFEYYFHIRANAELSRQLFAENRLVRLDLRRSPWSRPDGAPAWFAPRAMGEYDAWAFAGQPHRDFRILVDRSTGDLFVTDRQL